MYLNVPGYLHTDATYKGYFVQHRHSDSTFTIKPVSQDVISRYVLSLKSNAEGYDGINLKMIIMIFPQSLEYITDIINCSISSSSFPDIWKIAKILPLPKNNSPNDVNDLRPISILPCLSKVLERVVCTQLTEYLEQHQIIPSLQSGFRKGRSTTTALIDVTDSILAEQDKGMCTLLVLLDFSRAFDAINTNLLLGKMTYYGFDTKTILWFQSYLSNRKQIVKLAQSDGTSLYSTMTPVTRGVPQGSILGPILFILYCADIIKCLKKCRYHLYADDVQVYISFKPEDFESAVEDLNKELGAIAEWSDKNCLVLNPSKTKYMLFGTERMKRDLPVPLNVMLLGEPVERVEIARNLGLSFDSNLRFEKHVSSCVRNCFYRLKVLYKIRPFLTEELRMQLVESLVLSKLNYADIVYGPRLLARTKQLIQRVQNACARFCFAIPYRDHVTPYLNKHFILKMKSRRKLHLACLLFGVIKHQQPHYLYSRLGWVGSSRECARRQCSKQLVTHPHKSAAFRGSFRYAASKIWNNIPPPFKNIGTIGTFKLHLRRYLLNAQREVGNINLDKSHI